MKVGGIVAEQFGDLVKAISAERSREAQARSWTPQGKEESNP